MKKIIFFTLFIFIFLPTLVKAAEPVGGTGDGGSPSEKPVEITNPLATDGKNPSPQVLIGRVINATMGLVGSLALAMFIYGGFTWMLAAGNDQRVQKGKDILIWATIGLIVIFSSYALVRVIFTGLGVTE
jgi:hypothetical protein